MNPLLNIRAEEFICHASKDALVARVGNVHGEYHPSTPNGRLALLKVRNSLF